MDSLYVIKIGGNIIDDAEKLKLFLQSFASIKSYKILVHGGGKLATQFADTLGIQQQLIDGRRITDAETLKVVTMIYAGLINKNIVSQLQSKNCNAIGLCGSDARIIQAHKRIHPSIDFGFVGDIDQVNATQLERFVNSGLIPVIAPITNSAEGQLLNTNADTIAQEIAKAMSDYYNVELIYSFEKSGVLRDPNDNSTVIASIDQKYYATLKRENKIFAGMIPKIDNAFAALHSGVQRVIIGNAEQLNELIDHSAGTIFTNE